MEKLAFALVTVARKLKPYFQTHTMVVLTDRPLRRAISNPKATGRMALQVIELSEFDVQYRPHIAMKGQVVVDFIAEFTNMEGQGARACLNGVSTWTSRLTDRQAVELVQYSIPQKGTRSNAQSNSISLQPIMKQSMKLQQQGWISPKQQEPQIWSYIATPRQS